MTTFNWDCTNVEVFLSENGNSDVVYNVHWILTGVSDQLDKEGKEYTSSLDGWQVLNTDNINEFIPFADLTNEIVTQWVKDAMGTHQIDVLKYNINGEIATQINPITATKKIN